ncbi:MAG: hypothetical protein ACOZNI_29750 [Myxococcota bacterium]
MLLLLATPAFAVWPEDVSLVAMDDYAGVSTLPPGAGDDYVVVGYETLVKELGVAIANKPMAPAETLGVYGFHVGLANTFAFIRTGSTDGTNPTGWDLADPDEDPQTYLFIPQFQVRKGLPLSLELGANFGWIGMTRTGVFGGYGRWAPVEGYKRIPDLALQIGYAGYLGNDELEVGVLDMSATLGYSLPFGVTEGINQAVFSPYLGIGVNRIHAAPRADLSRTNLEGRLGEVTGSKSQAKSDIEDTAEDETVAFDKSYAPLTLAGGFRILNGDFSATLSAGYSPGLIPTLNLGFGFVY